jgi:hypothetical protein
MAGGVVATIVSGGQTGVDRAALDVALELGVACGGWCPRGRRAEDGTIPPHYPLRETPSLDYRQRTTWNVRDTDGTLILAWGEPRGGSARTVREAVRLGKPVLVIDLSAQPDCDRARDWLAARKVLVLNVAGPRQSEALAAYARAVAFLRVLLR